MSDGWQISVLRISEVLTWLLVDFWWAWSPLLAALAVGCYVHFRRLREREAALRERQSVVVAEEHEFVVLIEAARADSAFREEVLTLLRLEPFHRRSFLGGYLTTMQLRGAPTEFVQAVALLRDDGVAAQALFLLESPS